MELKDFIKGTITAITEAVSELNNELSDKGVVVSPGSARLLTKGNNDSDRYVCTVDRKDYGLIHDVEFNLSISETDNTNAGGGIKIKVIDVGISNSAGKITSNNIKFSIPVVYPSPKTQ